MMEASLVLYVVAYEECLHFYREVMQLEELFATPTLTCFRWGSASLMVEREDEERLIATRPEPRSCLRFLVADVLAETERLRSLGVEVDYQEHDWGVVAKFFDPDGNLCALKDLAGFRAQCASSESG